MQGALSLRARLTAIILTPLVFIAVVVGVWAVFDAQARADDRFNRSLLSAALAVSRDVAVSGGDAITPETNALLRDSFSGPVFYHVLAPDGAFVTGYATPPVPLARPNEASSQQVFEGTHQSRRVQALRFVDTMQVDGVSGDYTVTVWQERAFRNALVRDLVQGTILIISLLVATVAFVVWFGVRRGLRPLNDLEDAIARRNSEDLSGIRRDVPEEVTGIVRRLNLLFDQLSISMAAQADFISNAAHQLRNPIAGVLSLAEAVAAAPNGEEAQRRSVDLLDAARDASELSQKLLLLERAKAMSPEAEKAEFDLSAALALWVSELRARTPSKVTIELNAEADLLIQGDQTMLREAIRNLVDNALRHGGPRLTHIFVTAKKADGTIRLGVTDDGQGIAEQDLPKALERFQTLAPTSQSGLGVSIVSAIARSHSGEFHLASVEPGLSAELTLPQ